MARGWESKAVESQIESAEERHRHGPTARLTPEQIQIERELEILELSRIRTAQDLAAAVNPRYRDLLERTLVHLDARIAGLKADQQQH
jgi:hypothetical protein